MALEDGIIAYYAMNGNFADSFGQEPTLTGSGTPVFDAGQIEDASFYEFNGGGTDAFAFADSEGFSMSNTLKTVAGWAYVDNTTGDPGIVSNWANNGGGSKVQWLFWIESGNLKFQVRDTVGTDFVCDFGAAIEDAWFFFVLEFDDAADEVRLTINDGTPVVTAMTTGPATTGTTRLVVAGRNGSAAPLAGGIDALGFWDRILDAAEQTQLYAGGVGIELDAVGELDQFGLKVTWRRRDYRATDEVVSALEDAPSVTDQTTEYRARLIDDPDGTPDELLVTAWSPTPEAIFSRTQILFENAGVVPTRVRVEIETRHTHDSEVLTATQVLRHDFDLHSDLDDDEELGLLDDNEVSPVFVAPDSGDYVVKIGLALTTGAVEYRLNAGAWTTVIASGLRLGVIEGVVAADDLEFRHTQSGAGTVETILLVEPPTSAAGAFGILII